MISAETIAHAVERLRRGDVVAFPTETVYGLGADALNTDAVRRVFELKGRPESNPLIVHVSDEPMARRTASSWPHVAAMLAEAFWPGPLSIVVPRHADIPDNVTAGGPTVCVRCPDHPVAIALIETFDRPLVGPSANPSGLVSPTRADHVLRSFQHLPKDRMFPVLDGGPCRAGIESTVVALSDDAVTILRPGIIGPAEIAQATCVEVRESTGPDARSPGLMGRHYSPTAKAVLWESEELDRLLAECNSVVVIAHSECPVQGLSLIRLPSDPQGYAAGLYAALREADAHQPSLIAIEAPPDKEGLWRAIRDRLTRATGIQEPGGFADAPQAPNDGSDP